MNEAKKNIIEKFSDNIRFIFDIKIIGFKLITEISSVKLIDNEI